MNMRFVIILLAGLVFVPVATPALAGQSADTITVEVPNQVPMPCPVPGDKKFNLAQTGPADCCKAHKGVCGCRAGKIVCCDRTPSDQPGCTCRGDDGFLE